jgi:hypothetical protein
VFNLDAFKPHARPFRHWVANDFLGTDLVRTINAHWPTTDHPGWRIEGKSWLLKSSLLFPHRLPAAAQELAEQLNTPWALDRMSKLVGVELLADPWLREGPATPRLGGGLHEIPRGGKLNVHVDFEAHPSGLKRAANLLIYLNEDWQKGWGGALELHGDTVRSIAPTGGRAVLFLTGPDSWHGHPHPLKCPEGRSRRSLALYFYTRPGAEAQRPTTVYRTK